MGWGRRMGMGRGILVIRGRAWEGFRGRRMIMEGVVLESRRGWWGLGGVRMRFRLDIREREVQGRGRRLEDGWEGVFEWVFGLGSPDPRGEMRIILTS